MRSVFLLSITLLLTIVVAGCGSDPRDGISDVIDVIDCVERQEIDKSITGVNAFFNDSRFGSLPQQAEEIQGQLGLRYVRLLFAWTDGMTQVIRAVQC